MSLLVTQRAVGTRLKTIAAGGRSESIFFPGGLGYSPTSTHKMVSLCLTCQVLTSLKKGHFSQLHQPRKQGAMIALHTLVGDSPNPFAQKFSWEFFV